MDIAGGKEIDGLKNNHGLAMMDAAQEMRQRLADGQLVACYVTKDHRLEDLHPLVFAHDGSADRLLACRVAHYDFEVEIFVREKGYVARKFSNQDDASEVSTGAKKRGAKNKTRDSALIYWGIFPEGHGAAETSWDRAEDLVNAQLIKLGLKTVARNQFRTAVRELGCVDPVTGQPVARE